jgi:hypothetical protein
MLSFVFVLCFLDLEMDCKYCSACLNKRLLSYFVENATALPNSKVFATCYMYREKTKARRLKKRPALKELDSNVRHPPLLRAPPVTIPPRDTFRSIPQSHTPQRARIPPVIPPEIPLRPVTPPETLPGFLSQPQWDRIQAFHTHLESIKMETCLRCNARWFEMRLKDGVCYNCRLMDKGARSPFLFSVDNEMDLGEVPAYLSVLM